MDNTNAVLADKSDEYAVGHLSALLEVELHENGHTIGEALSEKLAEIAVKTLRQPTQTDAMREALERIATQATSPREMCEIAEAALQALEASNG